MAANHMIKSAGQRIERLDDEIKALNADKAEIYAEAKSNGLDVKVLKLAIRRKRAMDESPTAVQETDDMVDLYVAALVSGQEAQETRPAPVSAPATGLQSGSSRTRTHETPPHDPETGEITDQEAAPAPAPLAGRGTTLAALSAPADPTPELPSAPPVVAAIAADDSPIDQPVSDGPSVEGGALSAAPEFPEMPGFLVRGKPKYAAHEYLGAG